MKNDIWKALLSILVDDAVMFSRVTTAMITKKANMHRSTFYEYFADKFEALDYGLGKLMEDYHKIPFDERFKRPFQAVDARFQKTIERTLIEIQNHDAIFAEQVVRKTKEIMIAEVKDYLLEHGHINLNVDLLAHHYVDTVYALSAWNDVQKVPLMNAELDSIFMRLVIDVIIV